MYLEIKKKRDFNIFIQGEQSEMIQIWSKQGQENFEWNDKVSYCQPLFS